MNSCSQACNLSCGLSNHFTIWLSCLAYLPGFSHLLICLTCDIHKHSLKTACSLLSLIFFQCSGCTLGKTSSVFRSCHIIPVVSPLPPNFLFLLLSFLPPATSLVTRHFLKLNSHFFLLRQHHTSLSHYIPKTAPLSVPPRLLLCSSSLSTHLSITFSIFPTH